MKAKKEKKIRKYTVEGAYVLSKKKKLKSIVDNSCIVEVSLKDLERLYLYAKQRKEYFKDKKKLSDWFVTRLSPDVVFIVKDSI
jgi:hypothetical protein